MFWQVCILTESLKNLPDMFSCAAALQAGGMLRSPREHLLTKHRQLLSPSPRAALLNEDAALMSSALLGGLRWGLLGFGVTCLVTAHRLCPRSASLRAPPVSLPTLGDLSSASDCLPKMQPLSQGCSKDGEGPQAQLVQNRGLGRLPALEDGDTAMGCAWRGTLGCSGTTLHLPREGIPGGPRNGLFGAGLCCTVGPLLAGMCWWCFPADSGAGAGLESGRKTHLGNYLFFLARVS